MTYRLCQCALSARLDAFRFVNIWTCVCSVLKLVRALSTMPVFMRTALARIDRAVSSQLHFYYNYNSNNYTIVRHITQKQLLLFIICLLLLRSYYSPSVPRARARWGLADANHLEAVQSHYDIIICSSLLLLLSLVLSSLLLLLHIVLYTSIASTVTR